ncbi:hypothetical protein Vadar_006130 [Vaccinium darrowii]|uniref:Uncharacterized protein n=1 Tax=Vaccinium darrowii TaxID=229202 RepID=A0ACB7XFQ0_9ERIC|nr:hypothetical protein Vadar_006130 [Vaccinium darrowii]
MVLRNDIQDKIERGEFKFEVKEGKNILRVDKNPFPGGLNTNMVSVNMTGLPRTTLRAKVSLGAPSREAHRSSYDGYDSVKLAGLNNSSNGPADYYPSRPQRLSQERKIGPSEKHFSVFSRLTIGLENVQEDLCKLSITAPNQGRRRTVKPRITPPDEWPVARRAREESEVLEGMEDDTWEDTEMLEALEHDSMEVDHFDEVVEFMIKGQGSRHQQGLIAKDGQQQIMEGDVVELGETAKILNESMRPVDHVSSITILEEEAMKEVSKAVACVMFEKPTPKAANHIKPLYVSSCLDGMLVNHLLIDGGSAMNLVPRTTMTKLGKTEQDLIASSASLSDFKGGLTACEGILIMKLTIDQRPFFATTNHVKARFYDSNIGPMRVPGLDKSVLMQTHPTEEEKDMDLQAMLARFNAYLADGRMMDLHEEEERPSSANAVEFIYEDEGLEEVDEANKGDVIRFEALEAAPAKLDDLKADVQDPLDEINLGSEEEPKLVYIS